MARGRKPLPPPEAPVEINEEVVRGDLIAAEQVSVAHQAVMAYEGVIRDLGRLDGIEFLRRVGDVAVAQIFENVKNSKAYIGLPYIDEAGKPSTIGDFAEFCEVKLRKSYSRCAELSQNLRLLGPALYEQSEALGLRNVDYKALRALPEADQALVKRAIEETKSRDEVLDLLQEMAARHQREREEMGKQLADLEGDVAAKDRVIETQAKRGIELEKKLARVQVQAPDETLAAIRSELLSHAIGVEGAIANKLGPAFAALKEHLTVHGGACDEYLEGCLGQIEQRLREIRAEFGLIAPLVGQWAGQ